MQHLASTILNKLEQYFTLLTSGEPQSFPEQKKVEMKEHTDVVLYNRKEIGRIEQNSECI